MRSRRRQTLFALAGSALAVPISSFAQQVRNFFRIGFLSSEGASDSNQANRLEALRSGLRDLGYVEGRNIGIESRWAEGRYERLAELAAGLVALKVDVIVAAGTKATLAAARATTSIPIVVGGGDIVGVGLSTNLARPSGNVTGWMNFAPEVTRKLLELIKEATPGVKHVAYLANPVDPTTNTPAMQSTATSLKFRLSVFEARAPGELVNVFAEISRARCDALLVQGDTMFGANARTVADLALRHRLASASAINEYAEAGGLISYGPDRLEGYRRGAGFVDKLLKGAKPGDLPIQQATEFEFFINMATAKSLGLTIPQTLQARARLVQ
jgi:putative tryptophan/tyrosine transport system substrate-binding protein